MSILAALVVDRPSWEEDRLSLLMCECFRSDLSVMVLVDTEAAFISVVEVGGEGEVRSTAESAPITSFWVDLIDGRGLNRCIIQCLYLFNIPRVYFLIPDKERVLWMLVLVCSPYSSQMEVWVVAKCEMLQVFTKVCRC